MPPTRRQYLTALSGIATVGLAGCSDDGGTTTAPQTTTTATTTEVPTTPTPTLTTTTTTAAPTTTEPVDAEALQAESRELVQQLADGAYQTAIDGHEYTDQVASQLDATTFEGLWTRQTSGLGTFTGIADTTYSAQQGFHIVEVSAQFTDGQQTVRVVFDGNSLIAGIGFPQRQQEWSAPSYADQSTFTEASVTLQATDSCSLGGTITLPDGDAQVPGVVLVHGSGANDRDETFGPNKPLKDLAWGLASQGIAVLRYDKRTAACQVDPTTITIDGEVTDDALTAVRRLREHERVADSEVFVVGHSLGAMLAPRIAARAEDLAGIAMLAAPARPLWELLLDQTQYLAELDGTVTDTERQQIEELRQQVQRIRELDIQDDEVVLGGGRPYWQSLHEYDPLATAQELSLPRLLVQGGRDYQVTVEDDFQQWREALSGASSVSFERYPSLNHLLMPGEGDSSPEAYSRPNNVAQSLMTDLATWIDEQTSA